MDFANPDFYVKTFPLFSLFDVACAGNDSQSPLQPRILITPYDFLYLRTLHRYRSVNIYIVGRNYLDVAGMKRDLRLISLPPTMRSPSSTSRPCCQQPHYLLVSNDPVSPTTKTEELNVSQIIFDKGNSSASSISTQEFESVSTFTLIANNTRLSKGTYV